MMDMAEDNLSDRESEKRNTSKERNRLIPKTSFTEWYDNVLLEAKIADDRYPVKGFTVYMGWGFSIVKKIIQLLEEKLEKHGHDPMQFPVIIPEDIFQKEAEHIAGFSGEVFWVTHAGENPLERRLLLRPTSETAIYPLFKIWIRSHADLPLKMHQTCNVYRYETKATRPLYRGREFLWNEAHTAHADFEDSEKQVEEGVEIYSYVYDLIGLSYLLLERPSFDKFAGAVYSIAFDAWNPDGKINQIGTVHQLGQNFSKAFEITFENREGKQEFVFTTCYGMGFGRVLAAIIAQHGDDHGLVLPPIIAPKQIVIIPVTYKGYEEAINRHARDVLRLLEEANFRVVFDDSDLRPGEKYYRWEMFGVPIRIEVGPMEVNEGVVTLIRRDSRTRSKAPLSRLVEAVNHLFADIYQNLKEKSWKKLNEEIIYSENLEELKGLMEKRKIGKVNWCGDPDCAFKIKDSVVGEIRGSIWKKFEEAKGPCIVCGRPARKVVYVSRTI